MFQSWHQAIFGGRDEETDIIYKRNVINKGYNFYLDGIESGIASVSIHSLGSLQNIFSA